jgi:ATP-dependent Lon protease
MLVLANAHQIKVTGPDGKSVTAVDLNATQLRNCTLAPENQAVSANERIAVRSLGQTLGFTIPSGQENEHLPGWDIPKVSRGLFTDHFGLVSDVLAKTFSRLRSQPGSGILQGRVHLGGALSGRDSTAVGKTVSGLMKLLYLDAMKPVPDVDLEWAVRLALECRRRVKEQQKRIGSAEFRNTQFSHSMGLDGIEQFVSTPELQSEGSIVGDPLPPSQVFAIGPGGYDEATSLYRIEVTEGPGGGVRILN